MKKIYPIIIIALALILILLHHTQKPFRVEQLIGLDIKSDEAQSFLGAETGQLKTVGDHLTTYVYERSGLHIITDDGMIESVLMIGNPKDAHAQCVPLMGYKKFQGDIPFDISFTNTKRYMRAKFGKPSHYYPGNKKLNMQSFDVWDGMLVTYNTTDSTNLSANISTISISKGGDK